ncbi:MAG: hypothetical protein HXS49_09735 [Theionarchaea archaeon]|nr:hypothetical protein [Theionarchaea archaeon]MBU7036939.1 hypothetical protein [Theionarchaea archaeon]
MGGPEASIVEEAARIIDAAHDNDVTLRLLGGLATRIHCEHVDFCDREYSDIDMVGLGREKSRISMLFSALGYLPDERFNALHGHKRLKFEETVYHRHVDVFLDHFDMDHDWDLSSRLDIEKYTLPLSDLLLTKLQICKINEKDIRDILTLLKDCAIGEEDLPHTINVGYIAEKCSEDWGLYEAVLDNLEHVGTFLDTYELSEEDRNLVERRLKLLTRNLISHQKTARWKMRSAVGRHLAWCEQVEEE